MLTAYRMREQRDAAQHPAPARAPDPKPSTASDPVKRVRTNDELERELEAAMATLAERDAKIESAVQTFEELCEQAEQEFERLRNEGAERLAAVTAERDTLAVKLAELGLELANARAAALANARAAALQAPAQPADDSPDEPALEPIEPTEPALDGAPTQPVPARRTRTPR